MPETRLVSVGDRFIETTPTGHRIDLRVIEIDAEPKHPRDDERPYVRISRDGSRGRTDFVMSERVLLAVDWIVPLADDTTELERRLALAEADGRRGGDTFTDGTDSTSRKGTDPA